MTANAAPIRWPVLLLSAACILFVASRAWMLFGVTAEGSTQNIFAEMGFEYRLAASRGESFYDLHARRARAAAEERHRRDGRPIDLSRQQVEYPPLAIAWMVLPTYFTEPGDFDGYTAAARRINGVVDLVTFCLLWWTARRLGIHPAWPLLIYALAGLALVHLIYDRLDLVMAALMAAALALLVSRAHWFFAFALLAVAVNFKLVPVVMAPAFVVAATPVGLARDLRQFIASLLIRSAVFVGLCALCFLPFYLAAGSATLQFLDYHAERGVQVESVAANVLLLSGQVSGLSYTHGAIDVLSPLAPATALAATVATLAVLAMISLWMLVWARGLEGEPAHRATIAAAEPQRMIAFATLLLWSAMVTAKVFSPQYLLWLLPLAPLVAPRRGFGAGFLGVCIVTTVIFPYRYFTDIARVEGQSIVPPSALGVTLLTLRNAMFVTLCVALVASLLRRGRVRDGRGGGDERVRRGDAERPEEAARI